MGTVEDNRGTLVKAPQRKSWLGKLNEWFNHMKNLILTVLVVVVIVVLGNIINRDGQRETLIIIETIKVKDTLLAKQLDEELLTTILRDTINAIRASLNTYGNPNTEARNGQFPPNEGRLFSLVEAKDPNVDDSYKIKLDVGGAGVTIDNALQLIRQFVGTEPIKIDGESYRIGPEYHLILRTRGRFNFTIKKKITDLAKADSVMGVIAIDLLEKIAPQLLAVYLTDKSSSRNSDQIKEKNRVKFKNDSIKINDVISLMLENVDADDDIDGFFTRAYFLHANGYYEQAILNSKLAHQFDRKNEFPSILINWGNSLNHLGQFANAKKKYIEALKIDAGQAAAWRGLGSCEQSLNNSIAAVKCYEKAIQLEPTNKSNYFSLGFANYQIDRDSSAALAYETATVLDPSNDALFNNYGSTLCRLYRFSEAEAAFERAIAINENNYVAYVNYGLCLSYRIKYQKAAVSYQNALNICRNPENCGFAYRTYANLLSRTLKFKNANRMYQEALKDTNQLSITTLFFAYSKFDEGKCLEHINRDLATKAFNDAITLFNKVIALKKQQHFGEPEYGLAISYFKKGEIEVSRKHFKNAHLEFQKFKPESKYDKAEALYFLGLIKESLGDAIKGFQYKEKALNLEPFLKERSFFSELHTQATNRCSH